MNKEQIIIALNMGKISLKDAKEHAKVLGLKTTGRTKEVFIRDLNNGGQTMGYDTAKAAKQRLQDHCDSASAELKKFDVHKGPMGLMPDHIKFSDDYRRVKVNFDTAFEALRKYNLHFNRLYKADIQAERRAKWEQLQKVE